MNSNIPSSSSSSGPATNSSSEQILSTLTNISVTCRNRVENQRWALIYLPWHLEQDDDSPSRRQRATTRWRHPWNWAANRDGASSWIVLCSSRCSRTSAQLPFVKCLTMGFDNNSSTSQCGIKVWKKAEKMKFKRGRPRTEMNRDKLQQ